MVFELRVSNTVVVFFFFIVSSILNFVWVAERGGRDVREGGGEESVLCSFLNDFILSISSLSSYC